MVLIINVVLFVFLNRVPERVGEAMIKIALGNIILSCEVPCAPNKALRFWCWITYTPQLAP